MVLKLRDRLLAAGGASRALTRDELLELARDVDLDELSLEDHRAFDERCYARNTVLLNDHFELVVICWLPGQMSSIHDHGKSLCLYLVAGGTMKEERFEPRDGGEPEPTETRTYGRGDITIAEGSEVHRIVNPGPERLTTVHVYSPPLADVTNYTPLPTAEA